MILIILSPNYRSQRDLTKMTYFIDHNVSYFGQLHNSINQVNSFLCMNLLQKTHTKTIPKKSQRDYTIKLYEQFAHELTSPASFISPHDSFKYRY